MLPFQHLTPLFAIGEPIPAGWQSIQTLPLLVFVGVTGVGKSTTLERLMEKLPSTLLPDRRELTDQLIIHSMQMMDHQQSGAALGAVKDRKLRFEYTRRYRELYPGGMAHAVSQLLIDTANIQGLLIFDGLRGDNEITHAAQILPQAHFVMLDAPDAVRVQRLLGRASSFDQINVQPGTGESEVSTFASLGVADAGSLFTPQEEQALLQFVRSGQVTADDLRAKLQIVIEERRNYDPVATRTAMQSAAPERSLIIDTTQHDPKQVAALIQAFVADKKEAQPDLRG
jgi:hypothetical protein